MKNYEIYTDGSYRQSINQGGIGIVWICDGKKVFEYSKGFKNSTNNVMELVAIYIALRSIQKPLNSLIIYSDSQYAIGCISNPLWKPKKNVTLINKIKNILLEKQKLVSNPIIFTHVKGHNGDKWNEYCDLLAQKESSYDYTN